jgi:transposase
VPTHFLFEDEARFGRISDRRAAWAPGGTRPRVAQQQERQFVDALLAVNPRDGRVNAFLHRGLNADVMSTFLALTRARFPGRYLVMLLDGAGWHIAGSLVVPPRMHLEFLPPWSPELNPVEPVWDYVREHYTANQRFASLGRVESRLCEAFVDLANDPALVRSITAFSWVKAAILTAD